MSESWVAVTLRALQELGAREKPAELSAVYEAVKRIAPERCRDDDLYIPKHGGRAEPRWRKDVRDALIKLKRRGVAVNEGRGLWKLIKQTQNEV